jgi:serine protease Do
MIKAILLNIFFVISVTAVPVISVDSLKEVQSKVQQLAERSVPITVALVSEKQGSSGSGIICSRDGLILTAAHVIQGEKNIKVVFADGKTVGGKVLGANFSKDLGMVKIEGGGEWKFANRGESKNLEIGDFVVAMGHAAGFDPERTPPVRFGRVISKGPGNFFTTDCTLIGGDSGGPVFDLEGNIIGINSNIGQELRINNHAGIDGFLDGEEKMLAGEQWGELQLDPSANADMPVLGVGISKTPAGLVIGLITQKSKASEAGLRPGDIIVSINGEKIRGEDELRAELLRNQVGDKVTVMVMRDSQELDLKVELVARGERGLFR